ncbi:MAG: PAS domain S-box protein [Burkholderiales bacterium]|nr:PAS domain S-box protein [Burkholderiales bacterium]
MQINRFQLVQRALNFLRAGLRQRVAQPPPDSTDRLQAILDALPDLLFEVDLEGRVFDYHSPRTDLLTVAPAKLIGRLVSELLPAAACGVIMVALHEADVRGSSSGRRYVLSLEQGQRWFELSIARKTMPEGEVPRFIALSRDVTERVQIEIRESHRSRVLEMLAARAALSEVLQAITNAVEELNPGLRCQILLFDEQSRSLETPAAPVFPALPSRSDRIVSSAGTLLGSLLIYPAQAHRPGTIELQEWLSLAGIAIEKRLAAQKLSASETNYRTLIHWTPQAIAVHRGELFLYVNPAAVELFGAKNAQELVGTPVIERIAVEYRAMARVRQKHFYEHGTTPRAEQQFLRMDGSVIDVELQSTSIAYDGEPAVHLALHDISARKRGEAELHAAMCLAEDANRAKSLFLAAASHDLRQPTHALGMFVARLGQLEHSTETSHLIERLDTSVQAMRDLLDALLDISRLDAGAVPVHLQAFALSDVFDQLQTELALVSAEKGLSLRVRPCNVWVLSDPVQLHRILLNLLSNALRYTSAGAVLLACRVTQGGRSARIEVWDSGIGIAPEHQEAIFKEFYQVGNVERDRRKGLGLGLNIVQRTAVLLQHKLQMWSQPGVGSRFSVEVPLVPIGAVVERRRPERAQPLADLANLVVLVIEDDALVRESLVCLIAAWRAVVVAAEGLSAALSYLEAGLVPDLIISDYRLRDGENGIAVLQQLRKQAGRAVPACLISGDTDPALLLAVRQAGLTLLHKPVRPAKLRSLIARLARSDLTAPSN